MTDSFIFLIILNNLSNFELFDLRIFCNYIYKFMVLKDKMYINVCL